jgi:thiol-disulfide isomerase/thioredoxin
MRVRRAWLTIVAAGALALAACGSDTDSGGSGAGSAGGTPVDLSFTVPTVDGGEFEGTSLAGKPAVLWFWAPWCATCAAEAPQVSALADDYAGKVTVVGVAGLDDSPENMQQFVDLTGIDNFPQLADPDGVVWQRFEITAQSQFVILDADGAVDLRGLLDPAEIPDRLDRLVA